MNDYVTLGELKSGAASPGYSGVGLISENLGVRTLKVTMNIQQILDYTQVANVKTTSTAEFEGEEIAQRNESLQHTKKLSKYVLKGAVFSYKSELERNQQDVPDCVNNIYKEFKKTFLKSYKSNLKHELKNTRKATYKALYTLIIFLIDINLRICSLSR
mgnify:CR=1 FL=1